MRERSSLGGGSALGLAGAGGAGGAVGGSSILGLGEFGGATGTQGILDSRLEEARLARQAKAKGLATNSNRLFASGAGSGDISKALAHATSGTTDIGNGSGFSTGLASSSIGGPSIYGESPAPAPAPAVSERASRMEERLQQARQARQAKGSTFSRGAGSSNISSKATAANGGNGGSLGLLAGASGLSSGIGSAQPNKQTFSNGFSGGIGGGNIGIGGGGGGNSNTVQLGATDPLSSNGDGGASSTNFYTGIRQAFGAATDLPVKPMVVPKAAPTM